MTAVLIATAAIIAVSYCTGVQLPKDLFEAVPREDKEKENRFPPTYIQKWPLQVLQPKQVFLL